MQPVGGVARGDALIGLGATYRANAVFPLGGLTGDLTSVALVHAVYAIGARAVFDVRGAVWQVLSIDAAGSSNIPLDPGTADGTTADAGDFELSFSFAPLGRATGFSAGGHVMVKLPNSDETRGIGPNTTDVTIAALFSWGAERWRATGWVGVGILEAPTRSFEQNDVLAYALEWLWRVDPRLRVAAGARGRASTRGTVPIGTEDLGELRASVEWRLGRVAIDAGLGYGYTEVSGDWNLGVGLAWTLARSR